MESSSLSVIMLIHLANVVLLLAATVYLYPLLLRWPRPLQRGVIGGLLGLEGVLSLCLNGIASNHIPLDMSPMLAALAGLFGGFLSALIAILLLLMVPIYQSGGDILLLLTGIAALVTGGWLGGQFQHRIVVEKRIRRPKVSFLLGSLVLIEQLVWHILAGGPLSEAWQRAGERPVAFLYPIFLVAIVSLAMEQYEAMQERLVDPATGWPVESLFRQRIRFRSHTRTKEGHRPHGGIILLLQWHPAAINLLEAPPANMQVLLAQAVTRRIQPVLPKGMEAGSCGPNEVILYLPDVMQDHLGLVPPNVSKLKHELAQNIAIGSGTVYIEVYGGTAYWDGTLAEVDRCIESARIELGQALEKEERFTAPLEESLVANMRRQQMMRESLPKALANKQFAVVYQPQVDIHSGSIRGFEGLLRWKHPVLGLIPPAEFIPIAEEYGTIREIGLWVIEEACRFRQKLSSSMKDVTISVNLSAVQLEDPDFSESAAAVIRAIGLSPSLLELEVTESTLVGSFEQVSRQLRALQALGVRIALDDFGTGYSSLNYLKKLPFDTIKIDKSFLHELNDPDSSRVTESIIQLVKHLKYRVVTEGLETYEQLMRLKQWGCDIGQGYFFSRPLPEDQVLAFAEKQAGWK